jgi:hypothetical protein
MTLCKVPESYSIEYIQNNGIKENRIIPLFDRKIEDVIEQVQNNRLEIFDRSLPIVNEKYTADVIDRFINTFTAHLQASQRNDLSGFESYKRVDICSGCTQYIDDLYMKNDQIQVLENEYSYHERLNPKLDYVNVDTLRPNVPLIVSLPFCRDGKVHPDMDSILEIALQRNIPVHVDGAWIPCAKDIKFDFSHPAVHSFAISMSKGYGTSGWNRIGLRWTREFAIDSITLLTDFYQHTAYPIAIANYILEHITPDHLWDTHEENYYKVCKDFNLEPTQAIHVATQGPDWVYGIAPLLRYLEYNK